MKCLILILVFVPFFAVAKLNPDQPEQKKRVRLGDYEKARGPLDGVHSIGIGIGLLTTTQNDLNSHFDAVNAASSAGAEKFKTAKEIDLHYQYRMGLSRTAFEFRPSYFWQNASGGAYDYDLSAYLFFINAKYYYFEGDYSRLYVAFGVGYGSLFGSIIQPAGRFEITGSAYGPQVGLGYELCNFEKDCLILGVDYRDLEIKSNKVSGGNGTILGLNAANGQELEYNGTNVKTYLGGFLGRIAYQFSF